MSRGPLFSGHTYSRVSKNCRSIIVSAAQIERLWSVNENWRTLLLLKFYRFVLVNFHINNLQFPSSAVVLINSVGQKVWLGLFKGQASIPRWVSIFLKVLRKNNQNNKESLRSWRDLWRISASFHGCFRCFSLSCKPREQLQDLNWYFATAKKQ